METPNTRALSRQLAELGMDEEALKRVYSTFNVNAEAFREEMKRHGS
jgi:hypothetical protein